MNRLGLFGRLLAGAGAVVVRFVKAEEPEIPTAPQIEDLDEMTLPTLRREINKASIFLGGLPELAVMSVAAIRAYEDLAVSMVVVHKAQPDDVLLDDERIPWQKAISGIPIQTSIYLEPGAIVWRRGNSWYSSLFRAPAGY